MLVARKHKRVRLFSRNGHDWTARYPWIVEAALKNRQKHFVIDGEAVLLGVDAFRISMVCTLDTLRRMSSFTPSTSSRSMVTTCEAAAIDAQDQPGASAGSPA
jgi:hypothetical protein